MTNAIDGYIYKSFGQNPALSCRNSNILGVNRQKPRVQIDLDDSVDFLADSGTQVFNVAADCTTKYSTQIFYRHGFLCI